MSLVQLFLDQSSCHCKKTVASWEALKHSPRIIVSNTGWNGVPPQFHNFSCLAVCFDAAFCTTSGRPCCAKRAQRPLQPPLLCGTRSFPQWPCCCVDGRCGCGVAGSTAAVSGGGRGDHGQDERKLLRLFVSLSLQIFHEGEGVRVGWCFTDLVQGKQLFIEVWLSMVIWVVVSNIFYFHPLLGEVIQFDDHIFQMGGSTTN